MVVDLTLFPVVHQYVDLVFHTAKSGITFGVRLREYRKARTLEDTGLFVCAAVTLS